MCSHCYVLKIFLFYSLLFFSFFPIVHTAIVPLSLSLSLNLFSLGLDLVWCLQILRVLFFEDIPTFDISNYEIDF